MLYFHHIFSYCCLLHRSCVHVTKAVLNSWSIPFGVLLHLGTDEDTLYSHMYRNLNQCRFEGVGFTNTPTSKHLINYQIPIRRQTKLQLQHLAILNYYPARMGKWVPYGQNQGMMPKLDPCGSHIGILAHVGPT